MMAKKKKSFAAAAAAALEFFPLAVFIRIQLSIKQMGMITVDVVILDKC